MKKTNNKGFSLVELIIVIAIMAILIGVLAPQYIKYVEKSRISSDKDMVDSLTKAVQTACTDDDVNKTNLRINKNIIDKTSFANFVKNELTEQIDYSSARNLIKEKEEAKRKEQEEKNKAFMESKMKDLIEWVKKNTDKEGEEIEKLAERIYKKRYVYEY